MIRRMVSSIRRTSAVPMLVRAAVFAAAFGALLVAVPASVRSMTAAVGVLAGAALLAALLPATAWVTVVAVLAAGCWVAATVVDGESVTALRVLALAGLLYLMHSLAALAAALPHDAAVGTQVWIRWLLRSAVVILVSSGLSVGMLWGLQQLPDSGVNLPVTLGGLGLAAALVALLSLLARRS